MNPILALIIANTIWGAAPPVFKFALQNIPPFTLAFIRFFGASLLLLPFAILHWQKLTRKDVIEIFLTGFLSVTVSISFFFLGLQKTESIYASIIATASPVFLFFLATAFFREKPKRKVLWGMLLSLAGVFTIIFSPILLDGKQLGLKEIEGNIFFVIATVVSIILVLLNKRLLERVNPFVVTQLSFLFGSLLFLPMVGQELTRWSFSDLTAQGWTGIIFGLFFSSALAYLLYYYGMSKIKAQEIGLFSYIDPVVTVMIAAPLLGEYPNTYFFLGSLLVFAGIFIAEGRIHYHPLHLLRRKHSE